jgi:hypothetical protein
VWTQFFFVVGKHSLTNSIIAYNLDWKIWKQQKLRIGCSKSSLPQNIYNWWKMGSDGWISSKMTRLDDNDMQI